MSKIYIGKDAEALSVSDAFDGYTGVKIYAGTTTQTGADGKDYTVDVIYTAGTTTGRVLEIENPWGTQAMANGILTAISGYAYQPYQADGALLDPAAEIGDAVQVNDVVGAITKQDLTFGQLMRSNIQAPHDEEVEHEYSYQTATDKTQASANRELMEVRASLIQTIDGLEAEVVKQEGGSESTFGWYLKSDKFELKSSGNTVFKCDSTGITVNGNGSFTGNVSCTKLTVGNNTYDSTNFDSVFNAGISGGIYANNNGSSWTGGSNWGYDYGGKTSTYSTTNDQFSSGYLSCTKIRVGDTYWMGAHQVTVLTATGSETLVIPAYVV